MEWESTVKFEPYEQGDYSDVSEFNAVHTITIGELVTSGVIDFSDGTWVAQLNGGAIDWYDDAQRERFWAKFSDKFWYREIGEEPYKRWKRNLMSKLARVMPKYNLMYQALAKNPDPMREYDDYGKSRNIYSDFPQTMLSGNEDYASSGNDNQYERIREGSFVEKMDALARAYDDVDELLLKELDPHFWCLLTSNVNGY